VALTLPDFLDVSFVSIKMDNGLLQDVQRPVSPFNPGFFFRDLGWRVDAILVLLPFRYLY
jgi:hypothetical protein